MGVWQIYCTRQSVCLHYQEPEQPTGGYWTVKNGTRFPPAGTEIERLYQHTAQNPHWLTTSSNLWTPTDFVWPGETSTLSSLRLHAMDWNCVMLVKQKKRRYFNMFNIFNGLANPTISTQTSWVFTDLLCILITSEYFISQNDSYTSKTYIHVFTSGYSVDKFPPRIVYNLKQK
jgi:hypothetical protein